MQFQLLSRSSGRVSRSSASDREISGNEIQAIIFRATPHLSDFCPISRFSGSNPGQNRHGPLALRVPFGMPFLNPLFRRFFARFRAISGRFRGKSLRVFFRIESKGFNIGRTTSPYTCEVVLGCDLPCARVSGSFRWALAGDCGYNCLVVWCLYLPLSISRIGPAYEFVRNGEMGKSILRKRIILTRLVALVTVSSYL